MLAGSVTSEKEFRSKTAVSVAGENGYMLKSIVKADGDASLGAYLSGLLVSEIVIHTDGTFSFMKQGKELARVTENGISYGTSLSDTARIGAPAHRGRRPLQHGGRHRRGMRPHQLLRSGRRYDQIPGFRRP